MKIGIDLDDVVFEFTRDFLREGNKFFKKNLSFEDIHNYNFKEHFEVTLEEVLSFLENLVKNGFCINHSLCEGAKDSIFTLAEKHKILFITSRVFKSGTEESLNKHFQGINYKLIFSSNSYAKTLGKSKGDICLEEGVSILIEDSKEYAEECASKGIKVFLIDKPWNKNYIGSKNIIKVKNWKEVLEKL